MLHTNQGIYHVYHCNYVQIHIVKWQLHNWNAHIYVMATTTLQQARKLTLLKAFHLQQGCEVILQRYIKQ